MDKSFKPHELKFAFSDFVKLLRRHSKLVLFCMFLGAAACFSLAVTRPVVYLVQSSFRDKGKTQAAIRSALTDLLFSSSSSHDSEAISSMRSEHLISQVVKELHVQGYVDKLTNTYPELENAWDNVMGEWAYWWSYKVPILKEFDPILQLRNITYSGEIIQPYVITFENAHNFTLQAETGKTIKGEIGKPVTIGTTQFTIYNNHLINPKAHELFAVFLMPMSEISKVLAGQIVIDVDRDDKSLLKLKFKNRDRHFATRFLNSLMKTYQLRLVDEHEMLSNMQVSYLEKRQMEVGSSLEKLMENYVQKVAEDMSHSGFTSLQKEMDFLAVNLANNQQKIAEIEFETKRLFNINPESCVHYDAYTGRGDPAIINHLLAEIRALKQQSDTLELGLQKTFAASPEELKQKLDAGLKEVEVARANAAEAEELIQLMEGKRKGIVVLKALNSPEHPVSTWYATYQQKEKAYFAAPLKAQAEFQQFKEHFLHYLTVFKRMMHIKQVACEQRMRTQQEQHSDELAGATLETCRNLYLNYVKELNELQAYEKQHIFVAEQLQHPEFELSSLTALLHDPISHERIGKATQLMILLKDENNRTQRERERLQEELFLQKEFLSSHIEQIADLAHLKQGLMQDKINSLQAITLELTQQQISLLINQLKDYIASRTANLIQEKKLLDDHQVALHARMAEITSKWSSEQLMNHNLSMQQKFLENLASMVESKNITKNLEMIQSAPLDLAVAPLNPKPPHLLFFSLFGSLLGFLGISSFLFAHTMINGVPASMENLRLANFHVSGFITPFQGDELSATTPLLDTDLDTLRRLVAHYEEDSPTHREAQKLLIVNGQGPDFSNTLAKLLSKKGHRTLKLQLGFNRAFDTTQPGLLQYLEGKTDFPHIEHLDGFDLIVSGGLSRYSEELLRSPRFVELLQKLLPSYDWILGVSPVAVTHAEAENLAKLFDGTIIVVKDEPLQDLIAFSETLDENRKEALTFVIAT